MDVIEMMRNLFYNEEAQAQWKEDPEAYLEREGASDLSVAQINEAAQVAFSPTDLGASVNVEGNQTVGDFAAGLDQNLRTMDTGAGEGGGAAPAPAPAPQAAPPAPPAPPHSMPPAQQLQETINYYVTNVTETNVDDRDTFVDNSVDVINVGGEVNIDQDTTVASGDGAVAAGDDATGVNTGDGGVAVGDDANAPIVTGDDNIVVEDSGPVTVGDGNIVGDDNTVGDDNIDVDNSGTHGGGGGDVIIGDGNENNDVDIDIDGSGDGPINVGVGSGDTNQDNSTQDNDYIDDKDLLDVDVDNSTQDNDYIDDKDGFDVDVDAGFGAGRPPVTTGDAKLAPEVDPVDEKAFEDNDVIERLAPKEALIEEVEVPVIEEVMSEEAYVAEEPMEPEMAPEEPQEMDDLGE